MAEPSSLTAKRLRAEFSKVRSSAVLGGSEVMAGLARTAEALARDASFELRSHAFIVASVFDRLAIAEDEAPITMDDIEHIWRILGQPLIRAIDLLAGKEPVSRGDEISNALVTAYFEAVQ